MKLLEKIVSSNTLIVYVYIESEDVDNPDMRMLIKPYISQKTGEYVPIIADSFYTKSKFKNQYIVNIIKSETNKIFSHLYDPNDVYNLNNLSYPDLGTKQEISGKDFFQ